MADADDPTAEETVPEAAEPERRHGALVTRRRRDRGLHPAREELVALVKAASATRASTSASTSPAPTTRHPPGHAAGRRHPERSRWSSTSCRTPSAAGSGSGSRSGGRSDLPVHLRPPPGVEAMERETYDMFGIAFEGHP